MKVAAKLIALLVVLMFLAAFIGLGQPLILLWTLLFGWVDFLRRVVPEVRLAPGSLAVGVGCLLLVAILGHLALRWLRRELQPDGPAWRLRSTLMLLTATLLMFVCGLAATGVAHQLGWLIRDPQPMWGWHRPAANQIICRSNLREIYDALERVPGETLPPTPDAIVGDHQLHRLHCSSKVDPNLPYVYYGRGQTWPLPADVPLMAEPLANHGGRGMNVLFGDGRVEFLEPDEAAAVLSRRNPSDRD